MKETLIVFASLSGSTEEIADLIAQSLTKAGIPVRVSDVMDIEASEAAHYSTILLGAYTWGDGDLPDEFIDFFEELVENDLSGKHFAVFGSGDHAYEHFCGAVDEIEAGIKENGGDLLLPSLKIEGFPDSPDTCYAFGNQIAASLFSFSV